jgi:hypothetical protein
MALLQPPSPKDDDAYRDWSCHTAGDERSRSLGHAACQQRVNQDTPAILQAKNAGTASDSWGIKKWPS